MFTIKKNREELSKLEYNIHAEWMFQHITEQEYKQKLSVLSAAQISWIQPAWLNDQQS